MLEVACQAIFLSRQPISSPHSPQNHAPHVLSVKVFSGADVLVDGERSVVRSGLK